VRDRGARESNGPADAARRRVLGLAGAAGVASLVAVQRGAARDRASADPASPAALSAAGAAVLPGAAPVLADGPSAIGIEDLYCW
jgi:predicted nicotinamide N-methyase